MFITRVDFRKPTECATLLVPSCGWQAMKPARELQRRGRASEAKCEPPLLSGYVREGGKNYRSGLRIKNAINVENICNCWESCSSRKICAHSVTVGLAYLNPPTAVALPNEAKDARSSGRSAIRCGRPHISRVVTLGAARRGRAARSM